MAMPCLIRNEYNSLLVSMFNSVVVRESLFILAFPLGNQWPMGRRHCCHRQSAGYSEQVLEKVRVGVAS